MYLAPSEASKLPAGPTHFELRSAPDGSLVATVRRFVGDLCSRVLADPEVISRVTVATHELFDNATKYAASESCLFRIELGRVGDEAQVAIVTENGADEDHRRALLDILGECDSSSDRTAFYRELLRRISKQQGESGLGIGRVHSECELTLSSSVVDGLVRIRAEGKFLLTTGAAIR